MLVTLVTGVVVILATLSVLDISISQSSRISERVDADQRGRLAMEQIMQELHSSCTSFEATPVLEGSGTEKLELVSQPGSEAYLTKVTKHVISYSEAKHTLTDVTYASTNTLAELATPWKFSGTVAGTETLLAGVYKTVKGETTVPVFKYYKYAGNELSTTSLADSPELGKENAENTAEVTVSFTTAPTSERTTGGRTVDLSDSAVLRFDPASATGANEPCA
jgi:hypothetical protein